MIYAALILAAVLGVVLQVWALIDEVLRLAAECTCSKGRVCDSCLAASEAIRSGGGSA